MPLVITVGTAESFVCALLPQSIVAQRNVPPPSAIIPPHRRGWLDSFASLAVRLFGPRYRSGLQTHCTLCRPPSNFASTRLYTYVCTCTSVARMCEYVWRMYERRTLLGSALHKFEPNEFYSDDKLSGRSYG